MFKSFKHPRQIEKFERHTVTLIIFGLVGGGGSVWGGLLTF